jgi:hypothetical protein
MKTLLIGVGIWGSLLASCGGDKPGEPVTTDSSNSTVRPADTSVPRGGQFDEVVTSYLAIKNALADDDGKMAAQAGEKLTRAISGMQTASLSSAQKKVYDDLQEELKEHAEHISKNAGNLSHQRSHFDLLSKGMYDMVKAFTPGQALYQDYCPMFNDKKGATWLSETRDIRNPYYGKKMLSCGEVKEEIKK